MAFLRRKTVKFRYYCVKIFWVLYLDLVTSSLLLVIQLFIMESEESRKLKESSTVPEAGYVFLLCVVIGNLVFSLENLLN